MTDEIPEQLKAFLRKYVHTTGHLELLLFLFDGREQSWTVDELTKEMRTNNELAEIQLRDLADVVRVSKAEVLRFQLAMGNLQTAEMVRTVSKLHRTHRHSLIAVIYEKDRK
jgi:hypothetical protein